MHDSDNAEHAAHLVKRTALADGIHAMTAKPVLHDDNGATFKAPTVPAMLHWLGIMDGFFGALVHHDHQHSGIRYVSPAQRHAGADHAILQARHALYCQARERHPRRCSPSD